jgi:hypothetical protein
MKKVICALLADAIALSLCSCIFPFGGTGGSSSSEVQDTTEEATKYSTNVDDYVYSEVKYNLPYSGDFQITVEEKLKLQRAPSRMPQLSMSSADAKAINDDIHNKYQSLFDAMAGFKDGTAVSRTDYVACLNDNILSIVIETRTVDSPSSGFNVYNINVETGQRLSSDEVVALSNIDTEKAQSGVKAAMTAEYDKIKEVTGVDNEAVKTAENKSLTDDNLAKTVYYFDKSRKLTSVYTFYQVAGAETTGKIQTLDAVKTRG